MSEPKVHEQMRTCRSIPFPVTAFADKVEELEADLEGTLAVAEFLTGVREIPEQFIEYVVEQQERIDSLEAALEITRRNRDHWKVLAEHRSKSLDKLLDDNVALIDRASHSDLSGLSDDDHGLIEMNLVVAFDKLSSDNAALIEVSNLAFAAAQMIAGEAEESDEALAAMDQVVTFDKVEPMIREQIGDDLDVDTLRFSMWAARKLIRKAIAKAIPDWEVV